MYNMDSEKAMEELDMDVLLEKIPERKAAMPFGPSLLWQRSCRQWRYQMPSAWRSNNPQPDAGNEADLEKSVRADSLAGPNAPSHPWATMIKNPSMKLPEVYAMIPGDCAFIHFSFLFSF